LMYLSHAQRFLGDRVRGAGNFGCKSMRGHIGIGGFGSSPLPP